MTVQVTRLVCLHRGLTCCPMFHQFLGLQENRISCQQDHVSSIGYVCPLDPFPATMNEQRKMKHAYVPTHLESILSAVSSAAGNDNGSNRSKSVLFLVLASVVKPLVGVALMILYV